MAEMVNYNLFCSSELFDQDEFEAFIKKVEKMFRNSFEYNEWLQTTDRQFCAATEMSATEDLVKIEVHHFRRTLYQWAELITNKLIDNGLLVNSCYVCQILSDIHLNRCVPYIGLSRTYHDQLHMYKRQYANGEDMFMEKYPNASDYLYEGDLLKADNIINEHIEILKTISGKDD